METIYETYLSLPIDKGLLCLAHGDITAPYFCYPVNAKPIGFNTLNIRFIISNTFA